MGGQVAVAEPEPVWLHAVAGQFLLRVPGFVRMPPAAVGVDSTAQCGHAGVKIGTDAHPVHPRVVADVDDRGEFPGAVAAVEGELTQPEQVLHAQEEARPPDAAHENGDLHIADTKPSARAASGAVLDRASSPSRKRSSATRRATTRPIVITR